MMSRHQMTAPLSAIEWRMPIDPESYDRSPLTEKERWALQQCTIKGQKHAASRNARTARKLLARFHQPIADVFYLRHHKQSAGMYATLTKVCLVMHREMHRHGKMFWNWSPDEWLDTLCADSVQFDAKHGIFQGIRMTIMDAAYLLGGVTDLRAAGIRGEITETADVYFGHELMMEQCKRVHDVLKGKGYGGGEQSIQQIKRGLSMLFVLQRSPYLEDISEALIAEVRLEGHVMRQAMVRITKCLQHLGILSSKKGVDAVSHYAYINSDGMVLITVVQSS